MIIQGSLQFLPQTIYLYSHSIRPEAGNGKERKLLTHPMGTMMIRPTQNDNMILSSFLDELIKSLGCFKITPCNQLHPYSCQGTVSIRWSFPYHQWGYIYCEDIIRVIFLSTFHISDSLADAEGPCQILLGLTDFEKQIRPHSQREDVGGGRTEKLFVETCMPCHRCDTCIKSYRRK